MACYFGCSTQYSKAAWVAGLVCFTACIVLVVLGSLGVASCVAMPVCQTQPPANTTTAQWQAECQEMVRICANKPAVMLAVGAVVFVAGLVPLFYCMCCASRPATYFQSPSGQVLPASGTLVRIVQQGPASSSQAAALSKVGVPLPRGLPNDPLADVA